MSVDGSGEKDGLAILGLWDEAESSPWMEGIVRKEGRTRSLALHEGDTGGKVKIGGSGKWSPGRAFWPEVLVLFRFVVVVLIYFY